MIVKGKSGYGGRKNGVAETLYCSNNDCPVNDTFSYRMDSGAESIEHFERLVAKNKRDNTALFVRLGACSSDTAVSRLKTARRKYPSNAKKAPRLRMSMQLRPQVVVRCASYNCACLKPIQLDVEEVAKLKTKMVNLRSVYPILVKKMDELDSGWRSLSSYAREDRFMSVLMSMGFIDHCATPDHGEGDGPVADMPSGIPQGSIAHLLLDVPDETSSKTDMTTDNDDCDGETEILSEDPDDLARRTMAGDFYSYGDEEETLEEQLTEWGMDLDGFKEIESEWGKYVDNETKFVNESVRENRQKKNLKAMSDDFIEFLWVWQFAVKQKGYNVAGFLTKLAEHLPETTKLESTYRHFFLAYFLPSKPLQENGIVLKDLCAKIDAKWVDLGEGKTTIRTLSNAAKAGYASMSLASTFMVNFLFICYLNNFLLLFRKSEELGT